MFLQHTGFRSLWPELVLLPWLLLGAAYMVMAFLHGLRSEPLHGVKSDHHPRAH
jgi:hypothetical protein